MNSLNEIPCKDCITMTICRNLYCYNLTFSFKCDLSKKCKLFKVWWHDEYDERKVNQLLCKHFKIKTRRL